MNEILNREVADTLIDTPAKNRQSTEQKNDPVPYAFASEEDRCAMRHKVSIAAKMRFSCSNSFDVEVTDVSLAGFSCDALLQIHPGTRCWLMLPGFASLESEVVRHDNRGLGCAFSVLLNPAVLDSLIAKYGCND